MPFAFSALIVAVPTYIYANLVRRVDKYEIEPARYLIVTFLWGAAPAVIISLILELVFSLPIMALVGENTTTEFVTTALIAPVVEEVAKACAVAAVYVWRKREFDGWVDGIVYGSTVGFGFAYVENLIYLSTATTLADWLRLFFLRVIVLGFMHGFWTSLTGIGFGVARHRHTDMEKAIAITLGLSAAIAGHVIHNGTLVLAQAGNGASLCVTLVNYAIFVALMMGLGVVGGRADRALMKTYLLDEVPDVISAQNYQALCDPSTATRTRFHLLPNQQRAFVQAACELAQRKRQLITRGEMSAGADIDRLRGELRAMRLQA